VARRGAGVVRAEKVPDPERNTPGGRGKGPAGRRPPKPPVIEAAEAALKGVGDGAGEGAGAGRPDRPRVGSVPPRETSGAKATKRPAARGPRKPPALPDRQPLPGRPARVEDLTVALTRAVGARRVPRLRTELDQAARAYEQEHYADALRLSRHLVELAPNIPEIRELHGLSLYRLGRWREAIVHLEAFRELSGTAEENHVLADCYRALKRWSDVDELWEELRSVSPNAEVVNEGRIVVAGSFADRGDLPEGIRLLEKGWRAPARPREHHLRRAYALADLYERAGQHVRAREMFRWVQRFAPDFADIAERVRHLG
jgi:hypothetical protein